MVGGGVAGLTVARDRPARATGSRCSRPASGRRRRGVRAGRRPARGGLDGGAESFATRTTPSPTCSPTWGSATTSCYRSASAPGRTSAGPVPLPRQACSGSRCRPWAADVRRAIGVAGAAGRPTGCCRLAWAAARADERRRPGAGPDGPPGAGPAGRPGGLRRALVRARDPRRGHRDAGGAGGTARHGIAVGGRRAAARARACRGGRGRACAAGCTGCPRRSPRAWRTAPDVRASRWPRHGRAWAGTGGGATVTGGRARRRRAGAGRWCSPFPGPWRRLLARGSPSTRRRRCRSRW